MNETKLIVKETINGISRALDELNAEGKCEVDIRQVEFDLGVGSSRVKFTVFVDKIVEEKYEV